MSGGPADKDKPEDVGERGTDVIKNGKVGDKSQDAGSEDLVVEGEAKDERDSVEKSEPTGGQAEAMVNVRFSFGVLSFLLQKAIRSLAPPLGNSAIPTTCMSSFGVVES